MRRKHTQKPDNPWRRAFYDPSALDLNTANFAELANIPLVDTDGAEVLIAARPFSSWDDVERISGLRREAIDALRKSGIRIGER